MKKQPYPYLLCLLLALWLAPRSGSAMFDPDQPVLIKSNGGGATALGIPASPNFDNMVQSGARVDRLTIAGNGIDGLANQQWYIRQVPGYTDRYWFENRNSRQVLRMSNTVYNDGTQSLRQPIEQRPLSTTDLNEQWIITQVPVTDPYYPSYHVTSALNSKYLFAVPTTYQGNTVEALNPYSLEDPRMKWFFQGVTTPKGPDFNGVYTLSNVNANPYYTTGATKTVMQVVDKNLYPSARIEQGYDIGIASQQWQLVGTMPGPFAIYNRASGLVLQLYLASTADGAKLEQGQYSPNEATQRWYLEDVTTLGSSAPMYKITNGWLNGRCIQVEGQGQTPGYRMEIGNYIGINSQKWYLGYFSLNRGTNASGTSASETVAPAQDLAVYPNPATDRISVVCPGATAQATLTVTTLAGKQLLRQPYTGTIDVKQLPAGLYLLTVKNGEQTFRHKFVKQ